MQVLNCIDDCQDKGHKILPADSRLGEVVHRVLIKGAHDAAGYARFFRQYIGVGSKMPYTYLIFMDGHIEQALEDRALGWHANSWSKSFVGIGVVGDFRKVPPTQAQWEALVWLLAKRAQSRGSINFVGHDTARLREGREPKQCPGRYMDLDKLHDDVRYFLRNEGAAALKAKDTHHE